MDDFDCNFYADLLRSGSISKIAVNLNMGKLRILNLSVEALKSLLEIPGRIGRYCSPFFFPRCYAERHAFCRSRCCMSIYV